MSARFRSSVDYTDRTAPNPQPQPHPRPNPHNLPSPHTQPPLPRYACPTTQSPRHYRHYGCPIRPYGCPIRPAAMLVSRLWGCPSNRHACPIVQSSSLLWVSNRSGPHYGCPIPNGYWSNPKWLSQLVHLTLWARPLAPLPALLQRSDLWRRIRVSHGSCLDDEVFVRPGYRCTATPSVPSAKMSQPLMTPTVETAEQSNLADFMQRQGFNDYDALHAWSVDHSEEFWPALWGLLQRHLHRRGHPSPGRRR